jgi:hypothetical protein
MHQGDLELSDFTEPFGPRYVCTLAHTEEDGWAGFCGGPRGFTCMVSGETAEECCTTAWERVCGHHGSEECELSYKYTDNAWAKACDEEAQDPRARAEMLACPLCNSEHPKHEHAVRRCSAHLN